MADFQPSFPQDNLSIVQFYQDIGFQYKNHIAQFNNFDNVIESRDYTPTEKQPAFSMANLPIQIQKAPESSSLDELSPFDDPRLLLGREILDHLTFDIQKKTTITIRDYMGIGYNSWSVVDALYQPGEYNETFYGVTMEEAEASIQFTPSDSSIWTERTAESIDSVTIIPNSISLNPFLIGASPYLGLGVYTPGVVVIYGIPPVVAEQKPNALYVINWNSPSPNPTQEQIDEFEQITSRNRTAWKWLEEQPTFTTTIKEFVYRTTSTGQQIVGRGQMVDYPYYYIVTVKWSYDWNRIQTSSSQTTETWKIMVLSDHLYVGNEEYESLGNFLTWEASRMVEIDKAIQVLLEA